MTMRVLRIPVTLVVMVVAFSLLEHFLHWMNQPSDLLLYSGLLGVLSLVVAVRWALAAIWSRGRNRRIL
jgi:uncharacterized membrane protein YqhA